MGYTHYFEQVGSEPNENEWQKICKEARSILDKNIEIVCREYDREESFPQVNNDAIIFNGKGDDGHETFCLEKKGQGFQFCKTARKPYDKVVVEVLKKVKDICPNWLALSSDGDRDGDPIFK